MYQFKHFESWNSCYYFLNWFYSRNSFLLTSIAIHSTLLIVLNLFILFCYFLLFCFSIYQFANLFQVIRLNLFLFPFFYSSLFVYSKIKSCLNHQKQFLSFISLWNFSLVNFNCFLLLRIWMFFYQLILWNLFSVDFRLFKYCSQLPLTNLNSILLILFLFNYYFLMMAIWLFIN
jgi:hypothetical protein